MAHDDDAPLFPPIHPGEVLREEFLEPLGLSQNALARALHVSPSLVNSLVQEQRAVSADTALRLSRFFGTSADLWLGLQAHYDLAVRRESMAAELEAIEPMRQVG